MIIFIYLSIFPRLRMSHCRKRWVDQTLWVSRCCSLPKCSTTSKLIFYVNLPAYRRTNATFRDNSSEIRSEQPCRFQTLLKYQETKRSHFQCKNSQEWALCSSGRQRLPRSTQPPGAAPSTQLPQRCSTHRAPPRARQASHFLPCRPQL